MIWWCTLKLDKKEQSLLGMATLLLGFLFIILLKAQEFTNTQMVLQRTAVPSLIQMEQENEQLSLDILELQLELLKFNQGQSASTLATERLQEAKLSSGVIEVEGQGLRITQDDSKRATLGQVDTEIFLIHEEDIRGIINALWNGGAEAIAINGQRVMTNTEVFSTESYIQINGTRQMPPYVIDAIGDTKTLEGAFNFYGWTKLGDLQKQNGVSRKLEILSMVVIPAGKLKEFHWAVPVK